MRVWDAVRGTCLWRLARHTESVYSVSFSPDGAYLASGSVDGWCYVWSMATGRVVRAHRGPGSVFMCSWGGPGGAQLAVCYNSGSVGFASGFLPS